MYEYCLALRLIRFMPDSGHLSHGFDKDYRKHNSPYVLSVEAGRDMDGRFSSFRWRPQLQPLDPALVLARWLFHTNMHERHLGQELYPVIKKTALSGKVEVIWDDEEE